MEIAEETISAMTLENILQMDTGVICMLDEATIQALHARLDLLTDAKKKKQDIQAR